MMNDSIAGVQVVVCFIRFMVEKVGEKAPGYAHDNAEHVAT